MALTHKGAFAYETTGNSLLEFFSKAGAMFQKTNRYYDAQEPTKVSTQILDLFRSAWTDDKIKAMQLLMWLRDCRGGSGNRSGPRTILAWLGNAHPEWVIANIAMFPVVGRWDDLTALVGTKAEDAAMGLWLDAILDKNGLACKWAPREKNDKVVFHKLRKLAKMSPGEFRKWLATNTKVVETQMCSKKWNDIEYNHVPSVAMARSANAFEKHDAVRFTGWKASLANPESGNKVNAAVLFPHDCIRTLRAQLSTSRAGGFYYWSHQEKRGDEKYEDCALANAQFAALPDYMKDKNARIMCLTDFSGSMDTDIGGSSVKAIDVAMGLGLYCSDRLGKDNPFYRQFIPFSTNSRLVAWENETFSVAVQKYNDGWCGSTNISAALTQILSAAKLLHAKNEQMPNMLLVISDMQFDAGVSDSKTAVEAGMEQWEAAGYTRPQIVYWDLAGYSTAPTTKAHQNVAMVSGFSPSVLTAVVGGEDFSPLGVMERAIAKYKIVEP